MAICCALIKHEYSNFSLEILEYFEVSELLIREKHYWDIFNPEYNIAQDPTAPMSGRTHSEETKTKISDAIKGSNHSDETRQIISDAKKGENNPMHGKEKPEGAGRVSQQIEVTDITNNTTISYDSICEAARALNLPSHKTITNYILRNQQKPYKGRYTFKKL